MCHFIYFRRTANLARMRQFASRKSASKSLTSAIKLEEQEKTPLLEIEDVTSEDDENSPSFQEFDKYYNDLAGEEEMHLPYHATFFVAYFVPGTTDVGLMNTYEMEKYTERFTFFLYFATSRKETCIHLKQTKNKTAQSRLVELMNKGAVCYRQVNQINNISNFIIHNFPVIMNEYCILLAEFCVQWSNDY